MLAELASIEIETSSHILLLKVLSRFTHVSHVIILAASSQDHVVV